MSRFVVAALALSAAGLTTSAGAADLYGSRAPNTLPQSLYRPDSWAGPYLGANLGYAWGSVANNPTKPSGFVGGVQAGYNWQSGSFVFGLEGQGNWADLSGQNASAVLGVANRTRVDAFGLITGQVGYAWNNALLYVKGGAAVTSNRYRGIGTGGLAGAEFDGANDTRWGGAVGVGFEYGFAPNWSVGLDIKIMWLTLVRGLQRPAF